MQEDLFAPEDAQEFPTQPTQPTQPKNRSRGVLAAPPCPAQSTLAATLPPHLRMGVSTWSYPGWDGLVWNGLYDASVLSRKGLSALSQHPLMRTVCIDRTFWRPLTAEQYAQMAAQVPEDFRFVVKCPNVVTDALVRTEDGQGQRANPGFMQPQLAVEHFVTPCLQGLGQKMGVLVFQLSPLPWEQLRQPEALFSQLRALLAATRAALAKAPKVIIAVEVRDPILLEERFIATLRAHNATMCLGLHGKMPPIEQQLPWLRQLWPTPLVCRWNLNISFGPFGYPAAQEKHKPFGEIRTPDSHTRTHLARTIAGITGAGQAAFVTISNDAEGCAPRSIVHLAQEIKYWTKAAQCQK